MAWRRILGLRSAASSFGYLKPHFLSPPSPPKALALALALTRSESPSPPTHSSVPYSTSFLVTKTPKKFKKKRAKKPSPRSTPVTRNHNNPGLEALVERDARFRFLTRSKDYLSRQPDHVLRLDSAGKLYRELGFPRGRKVTRFIAGHPLLFQTYRHADGSMWVGFTDLMEGLVEEERQVLRSLEGERVNKVKKLLMMCRHRRMPLSKVYHCRSVFGVPDHFRDWVRGFPDHFRVVDEGHGGDRRSLELVSWDPALAVSALEKDFVLHEDRVRRMFAHGLPLVSPYSDGWRHEPGTVEAEKYRLGVLHELLSLTLEKRASIHHIVEFKEELSLTRHTYQLLRKQPRAFYLAGTEMNWCVFLRDAYDPQGRLLVEDPQVAFYQKLYRIAQMQSPDQLRVLEEGENG